MGSVSNQIRKQDWESIHDVLTRCSESRIESIKLKQMALWMFNHQLIDLKQFQDLRARCTKK